MDGLVPELAYNAPFPHSPQEVFVARREDVDGPHLLLQAEGKRGEGKLEKSLEDSGNIHDDHWQDTSAGLQGEDRGPSGDTHGARKTRPGESAALSKSPGGVGGATSAQLTASGSAATWSNSNQPGAPVSATPQRLTGNADSSASTQEVRGASASQSERQTAPSSQEVVVSRAPAYVSKLGDVPSPTRQAVPELTRLPGRFPERVVDAVLSVQQSWPAAAFASHSRSQRKRRGLLGRKTKSLSSLADLAAAQERSDLEENLLEQARLIMQVARVPSGLDLTTTTTTSPAGRGFANADGEETVYDQDALAVEWVDGHFHPTKSGQALIVSRHPHAPAEDIPHAWLVSPGRGTAPGADQHTWDFRLSMGPGPHQADILRSVSEEAARHIMNAGFGGRMQAVALLSEDGSARRPPDPKNALPDAESITSTTSVYGSSSAPSVSDLSDAAYGQTEGERLHHHPQLRSRDVDSDSLVSDERLLSSGELEVAAINARAAVMKIRPQTDTDASSRALSPGEEILADILARQRGAASPAKSTHASDHGSARRSDQRRIRGASPRRRPTSRQDECLSPEELLLPEETAQRLQQARLGLYKHETLEDMLQSGAREALQSAELSASQLRMLRCKAMSTSDLGRGRYLSEEDQQVSLAWQVRCFSLWLR